MYAGLLHACARDLLAVERADRCVGLVLMTANLNAGIEGGVGLGLELEHEVTVLAFGAEEAIGTAFVRRAYDLTGCNGVLRRPVTLLPAVERLAVEQRDKRRKDE